MREERPETKVIMITSHPDDEARFASIIAGASGYVVKPTRAGAFGCRSPRSRSRIWRSPCVSDRS
jgi:DNA-binding NarL/FixJ family response regulator